MENNGHNSNNVDNDSTNIHIRTPIQAFNEAYDCLSMKNTTLFKHGVQLAISTQKVCLYRYVCILYEYLLDISIYSLFYH